MPRARSTDSIEMRDQAPCAFAERDVRMHAPCAAIALRPASSPSTSFACLRAATIRSSGKGRELARLCSLDQRGERLGVEPLHLGERVVRLRRAGMRDDRLEFVGSSAFQAFSETMHSPVPFGLLKPG